MSGKYVLAVLPTGFGKSVIYQSFVIEKDASSIVVIVPLRSIIDVQLQSNDFGLKAVAFEKKPELMKDIVANKFQVIFASAEQALSKEFRDLLKDELSEFRKNLSLVVVDECHTIETWYISVSTASLGSSFKIRPPRRSDKRSGKILSLAAESIW